MGFLPQNTKEDYAIVDDVTPNELNNIGLNLKHLAGKKGVDIASAASLTLGTDGNYFDVTGNTGITAIGTIGIGSVIKLHFDGILTITHHSTDLILPNGMNLKTYSGLELEFVEYNTGKWRLIGGIAAISPTIFTFTALGPGIYVDTDVDGLRVADRNYTIQKIILSVSQAGSSGSSIVDINVGNANVAPTTIFTTQANRPAITAGTDYQKVEAINMDIASFLTGQIMSVDVDQIATSVENIVVQVICI